MINNITDKLNKKNLLRFFFGIEFLVIIWFTHLVLIDLNSLAFTLENIFYSIGQLFGLIAFLFLATLIIVGDFARLLDKKIGLDSIIKFQRKFSLFTTFFVLFHPIFFIFSYSGYAKYLLPDFSYFPMVLGTIGLYLFIVVEVCSMLYKRISNFFWQIIHIITYVLFFFALNHAMELGTQTQYKSIQIIFGIIVILFFGGVIYRTTCKIKQIKNKKYEVAKLEWETKDTFSLYLKNLNGKKLNFKAGQFCFLRINSHKLYSRHPFTISNSPNEKHLRFTIKLSGKFTKVASELKKGDKLTLEGPFGVFTNNNKYDNLVFIAGGVGITPFMSLIEDKIKSKNKNKQNVNLLYGCRNSENIIFKKELDKINEKWFKKTYVLSNEKKEVKDCKLGYIDEKIIKEQIKGYELNKTTFYICGPEILKNNCYQALKEMGIESSNIYKEDFFW